VPLFYYIGIMEKLVLNEFIEWLEEFHSEAQTIIEKAKELREPAREQLRWAFKEGCIDHYHQKETHGKELEKIIEKHSREFIDDSIKPDKNKP